MVNLAVGSGTACFRIGALRKRLPALVLTVLVACLQGPAALAQPAPVTVESGVLAGVVAGDAVVAFKGVPYARPPVGPLRWRPPQPALSWSGVRDAAAFGPVCPQPAGEAAADNQPPPQSEDCLTLNVWAPAHPDRPAPVMVWLHGGGNRTGSSSGRYFDGTAFARDGVVLVSLNYRLGALGFFAHPALTGEAGAADPLANYGLMDQIAALQWVRRNIRAFGGDPDNVTLFGESAGAVDTLALMTAPAVKGLFRKAIVESGGLFEDPQDLAEAEAQGAGIATALGLPGARTTAAQLRALSADALAGQEIAGDGPIIDGRLLGEDIAAAFGRGHAAQVTLMIGSNSNEGSLMDGNPDRRAQALAPFTAAELATARRLHPETADDDALAHALFRDQHFAVPARWIADQASATAPVYLYRFSYVRVRQRGRMAGANHASEIPYVFDTWSQSPGGGAFVTDSERAEASLLHACWVSFARTGTPTCPPAPVWQRHLAAAPALMDFGEQAVAGSGLDRETIDLVLPHSAVGGAR